MLGKSFIRCNSGSAAGSGAPIIRATLLLLRTPVITADLPKFQQQYYDYQSELWKRLMWTFPKWFYYRPGTIAEQRYRELNKPPVFNNPNLEFVGGRPEIRHQRDRRFKQELRLPKTYDESESEDSSAVAVAKDNLSRKIVPNSRTTEADQTNDQTSLERSLARTLYLVTSENGKPLSFPSFANEGATPLHKTAEDGLIGVGGNGMNYFNVSPKPCHVNSSESGEKEFFIKLHILSGDFKAQNNVVHRWLSKEELAQVLEEKYYNSISHLISDV